MRNGFLALLSVVVSVGAALGQVVPSVEPFAVTESPSGVYDGGADFGGGVDGYSDTVWFRMDYSLWWVKQAPLPIPLMTAGSAADANPAALGQPGTAIVLGNSSQEFGLANGLHFATGFWINPDRSLGIEGGWFGLERRASNLSIASDATGSPFLGQPIVSAQSGNELVELISLPGFLAGSTTVTSRLRLQGWEVSGVANAFRAANLTLDLVAGIRAVYLDEDLQMTTDLIPLQAGFLTFLGQNGPLADPPSRERVFDHFSTQNHFYGTQVGGRLDWNNGRFSVAANGTASVGVNQQLLRIDGSTSLINPGAGSVTAPGGLLALRSNSGRFFKDTFSVIPEGSLKFGYQLTEHMEAHVAYNALYWNNVIRPGNQLDRTIDFRQAPSDPAFVAGTAALRPAPQFQNTDFWAQGIDFGMLFRY